MLFVSQFKFDGLTSTVISSVHPGIAVDQSEFEKNSIQVGARVRDPIAAVSVINTVCNVLESSGVAYTRCD